MDIWLPLQVNAEPWRIGPLSTIRNGGKLIPFVGKDSQLEAYKEAVREAADGWLTVNGLTRKAILDHKCNKVTFYIWRQLGQYLTNSGRNHTKHIADATNMQKATEDALQGILFANDRQNRDVRTVIMEQSADLPGLPWVLVHLEVLNEIEMGLELPGWVLTEMIDANRGTETPALFSPTGSINLTPEDLF